MERIKRNSRRGQRGAGVVEYVFATGVTVAAVVVPFGSENKNAIQRLTDAIRGQQEAYNYSARLPALPNVEGNGSFFPLPDGPVNPVDSTGGSAGKTGSLDVFGGGGDSGAAGGGSYGSGQPSTSGNLGDGMGGQSLTDDASSGSSLEDFLQAADQPALDDKAQFMQCRQEQVAAVQQKANLMPANSPQQTELQATAERMRLNTVANEHAGLVQHLNNPGQPVPAGWQNASNSKGALGQVNLSPSHLTSGRSDFRAGVYTPKPEVLGGDFSSTLTATGSRASSEGWHNTAQQAIHFRPDDQERIVKLSEKVYAARPSQVTGGMSVTPLASGLSATATEGDNAKDSTVSDALGADSSDLPGSDSSANPSCSDIDLDDTDDLQFPPRECQGSWSHVDSVTGYGKSGTARDVNGSLVRLRAADARGGLHLNSFHYTVTYTSVDENGDPISGIYPVFNGTFSSFILDGGTSHIFSNPSLSDWTVSILNQQNACGNCGEPQIRVQQCIE